MNTLVPVRSEVVPLEQQSAIAPAEEPVDLDTELDRLDATLATLDELSARQREFPRHIAEIDAKLAKLAAEDLSTLEALESRQAQQRKLANMKLLADSQAKKTQAAIGSQQELAIKIGTQIAGLLETRWWKYYVARATEIEVKFDQLLKSKSVYVWATSDQQWSVRNRPES